MTENTYIKSVYKHKKLTNMLNRSKSINENYACRILRVDAIEPIPNANSISLAVVGTDKVVVPKSIKVGDIVAFFPVGSIICDKYLREHNLYEEPTLNSNYEQYCELLKKQKELQETQNKMDADIAAIEACARELKSMKGMFNKQGRVRMIKLRGVYSEGYLASVETLEQVWPELKTMIWSRELGKVFDMIGDHMLCWKYVPKSEEQTERAATETYKHKWWRLKQKKLKKFDRIVPGQFAFHYDTGLLEKNAHLVDPDNNITITVKLHGTSEIIANVLVNRKLTVWERLKKFIGCEVPLTEYGNIYSSRRVIQNKYINPTRSDANSFYGGGDYGPANQFLKDYLAPGLTVYGELVGYKEGTSKCFQSPKGIDHDYGCKPGQWRFMPYRITSTLPDGKVREWEIKEVCNWVRLVRETLPEDERYKLMPMELLYSGKAGAMYDNLYEQVRSAHSKLEYYDELEKFRAEPSYVGYIPPYLENYENWIKNLWRIEWVERMKKDKEFGMELPEPLCNNPKAPREGIVIRIVGDKEQRAFKLKTQAHKALAQKSADAGEVDMEDNA